VAFVSLVSEIPIDLCVEVDDDTSHVVIVPIAHCSDTDRLVQVECRLTYTQNPAAHPTLVRFHEFSFTILVVSLSGDTPTYETQDRAYAQPYLPASCRPLVMPIVCAGLRALVDRVRPPVIYRVTKSRNPPEKALRKHILVTHVLEDEGYTEIESGTDPWGRRFWVLGR
jgi:hypothetical protein